MDGWKDDEWMNELLLFEIKFDGRNMNHNKMLTLSFPVRLCCIFGFLITF